MNYAQFVLIVNAASILILLLMTGVLLAATRFKGANGYAAMIAAATTVPVYLYNVSRTMCWFGVAGWLAPLSFSVNTMLMPLLLLFVQRSLDSQFRFRPIHLLHFAPAILLLAGYLLFALPTSRANMVLENTGTDGWIGNINSSIVALQIAVYFPIIFVYLRSRERLLADNCSDADLLRAKWIKKFITLFAVMLVAVMVCYALWQRTDAWLIQIMNVIIMTYLVYNSLIYPPEAFAPPIIIADKTEPTTDSRQFDAYAAKAADYLLSSEIYTKPDLTIRELASAIGVSGNNLSKAINKVYGKNFFELVNRMRIDRAKRLLTDRQFSNQTIESISESCGFRSKTSFYEAFGRYEATTPARWKKEHSTQ